MSFISIFILAASSSYPSDWSDWRFWVFLAALLGFYYAFNSWSAKRRRRALAQRAPSMGFLWLDTMPESPRGIAFLRTGLGGELSNAMTGSGAGCEVTLFDFEYETGDNGQDGAHSCADHRGIPLRSLLFCPLFSSVPSW